MGINWSPCEGDLIIYSNRSNSNRSNWQCVMSEVTARLAKQITYLRLAAVQRLLITNLCQVSISWVLGWWALGPALPVKWVGTLKIKCGKYKMGVCTAARGAEAPRGDAAAQERSRGAGAPAPSGGGAQATGGARGGGWASAAGWAGETSPAGAGERAGAPERERAAVRLESSAWQHNVVGFSVVWLYDIVGFSVMWQFNTVGFR